MIRLKIVGWLTFGTTGIMLSVYHGFMVNKIISDNPSVVINDILGFIFRAFPWIMACLYCVCFKKAWEVSKTKKEELPPKSVHTPDPVVHKEEVEKQKPIAV